MMKPNRKLKKQQTTISKFDLEEIIGLTVTNGNGLASSISDSRFVYMAGCVVVLYDVHSGTQSHLMVSNRSPKPLSCVAFSQDGNYIAAGESGHQPSIIVWSSTTMASISELKGHQSGVACTAFSPDGKHLVSIGTPKDGNLCLWDWRSGILVKKLKAYSSFSDVTSVSFSADAKFILTSGKRHLKIWTLGLPTKSRAKTEGLLLMHGKTVNLGNLKGCTFIDITSPFKINGNVADGKCWELVVVYALTDSGLLCLLHDGLKVMQTVNLNVEKGYALSASQDFIACACNNGVVKLYTVGSLEYAGSLLYSEDKQIKKTNDILEYPDAIACQFSTLKKLVVVYRDHSLYIWNINGKFQATKCCVLVSHSACIWDIKNLSCENMHDPSLACTVRGCNGGVYFATCSADGTIRLWGLALQSVSTDIKSSFATNQDQVITEPLGILCLVGGGTFERESVVSGVITTGYRCMAVSSDGNHLAAGDFDGNLHIFNLETSDYTCIQDAHEAEILSLNFSLPVEKKMDSVGDLDSYYFLASGGSDKMIHLFDVTRNFNLIASLDDHSAAVSYVKLTANGRKIVSCGSDRSLIFRDIAASDKNYNISHSHKQKTSHGTTYDIAINSSTETAVTVGEDKKIDILDIAAGQVIRSFKQGGDFGDPIKVCLDPSCSYVVCSYSDRSICMYDFTSGEMVARAMGHSEAINGIIILPDCRHLVSVGNDGCIFVWKVPEVLTLRMLHRIKENSCPLSPNTISQCTTVDRFKYYEENYLRPRGTTVFREGKCPQETPTFRFSVSRLPHWAKSKVTSPFVIPMGPISSEVVGTEDQTPSKSSGVNAPVKLVLHTPSNHSKSFSTSSPRPNYTKDSTTEETCRSFALDKRWFTIHNVCLDLLYSPEGYNMKAQMVPLSSSSIQGPALEETEIEFMKHSSINPSLTKISLNNACASGEEFGCESSGQLQLSTSVNQVANECILNSGKNSASSKGTTSSNSPENLLCSNHITSQSNSSSSSLKSTEVKMMDRQQECDIIIDGKNNTFNACKEALRTLDNASKTTLQVFSKLRDIKLTNGNPEEPEAQFYAEATQMLQPIAKNVHEIAKLTSSCGVDKVDIPGFEPLLGKFAESLSQRVIELLKESCTSV